MQRFLSFLVASAVLGCGLSASAASAQLAIDRLWVDFEPGDPKRADIVIRNESQDRYYITVAPVEVELAGDTAETRTQIADPEQLGLLVTPNRLIVEPGGMRSIRLVSLNGELEQDRIYRVKVSPQVGDIEAKDPGEGNRGVSVKLLTAYDLLVTARPPIPAANIASRREANTLVLENRGNTNTLLFEGRACPVGVEPAIVAAEPMAEATNGRAATATVPVTDAAPATDSTPLTDAAAATDVPAGCTDLGARRMYAGNKWTIELPAATERVYFKERVLASAEPRQIQF